MKSIVIKKSLLLIIALFVFTSCNLFSKSPTGDPYKDAKTYRELVLDGNYEEADAFMNKVQEYYFSHYNGEQLKEKLKVFGENM